MGLDNAFGKEMICKCKMQMLSAAGRWAVRCASFVLFLLLLLSRCRVMDSTGNKHMRVNKTLVFAPTIAFPMFAFHP
ncbi:MAG: hypothetical protein BYD32DRAFT_417313 [Podila humilis]|nr:MAG: hypothetical protein BYD32DRAFT_417313 [Podila humilis]